MAKQIKCISMIIFGGFALCQVILIHLRPSSTKFEKRFFLTRIRFMCGIKAVIFCKYECKLHSNVFSIFQYILLGFLKYSLISVCFCWSFFLQKPNFYWPLCVAAALPRTFGVGTAVIRTPRARGWGAPPRHWGPTVHREEEMHASHDPASSRMFDHAFQNLIKHTVTLKVFYSPRCIFERIIPHSAAFSAVRYFFGSERIFVSPPCNTTEWTRDFFSRCFILARIHLFSICHISYFNTKGGFLLCSDSRKFNAPSWIALQLLRLSRSGSGA